MGGERLYRQVVDQMLELIDSGEYPVGSRLPPERELAERFGVSRPTIREAVIALEVMERIGVKSGSGMYITETKVPPMVSGGIAPFELMETRVLVEGEAAALAATMITDEQLEELEQALEAMEQENAVDDLGDDDADRQFHAIIAKATQNQTLQSIIENLWTAQEGIRHIRMAHQAVCLKDIQLRCDEHRAIYDALAKRDAHGARVAMRRHFSRTLDALHHATEEEAVAAVRRKLSEARERFSVNRLESSSAARSAAK
ncbi:MAG: FadR family transcriptional regulator [Gammaproteobacteria bacterium]|nr:FadR family transcriptional regulator [Gammaproteobacteria bacterium]